MASRRHGIAGLRGRWELFVAPTGPAGSSAWGVPARRKGLRSRSPGCGRPWNGKRRPRRTFAYINALGYYELYVNGKKVDDHVLSPAVCDYSKRNLYVTHEITDYLVAGKNSVALWLGRGWYVRGHPGVIHDGPLVRAEPDLLRPDGSTERSAPMRPGRSAEAPYSAGAWNGLRRLWWRAYDAGLSSRAGTLPTWTIPTGKPPLSSSRPRWLRRRRWCNRTASPRRSGPSRSQELTPGVYLVEMARNFTGWLELRVPAPHSSRALSREARSTPTSRRRAAASHEQPARRGDSPEGAEQTFRSRFNYHAFSFVRITGMKRPPAIEDIGIPDPHRLPASGRIRVLQRPLQPDLSDRHLDLPVPDAGRLRGGLPPPGAPGLRRRRGHLDRDGDVQLRPRPGCTPSGRRTGGTAQNPRPGTFLHGPELQDQGGGGPMWSGFRSSRRGSFTCNMATSGSSNFVSQHPEVARVPETKTVDRVLRVLKS